MGYLNTLNVNNNMRVSIMECAVKWYSNPITGLDRPWGFQEVEAPGIQDSQHMKVVRLLALGTGRLYPPGNITGTHFC